MNVFSTGGIPAPSAFRRALRGFVPPRLVLSCLAFLVLAVAPVAFSGESGAASPTRAEVSEKKTGLKELRGQIETLRKEMAAAQGARADAADRIKDIEREISATQRELHGLSGQRDRARAALKDLGAQERTLGRRLDELRAQLEDMARRQYFQGRPDALRLLLDGKDANQMARDLYYLAAIGNARGQLLRETETLLERKQATSEAMRERARELSAIEARQKEQHARLLAQRERRKETLAEISSKISRQRKEIGQLQRDEKQLARLVARLDRIIAARNAPRREGARTAEPNKQPPGRGSAPGLVNEHTPEALPAGSFAALKGSLRLPVRGTLTNRFGGARQEGGAWKGLFIRAPQGSDVKAIAAGRVVFADWLRGFGNLLIVDHGGGYLSIYGYNDAVLKQVGEDVRGGDPIASAGNSGGNPESGLYFELRHRGQPVDPLKWVDLK
ncbi:MAG: peptidoglycan DD-metalloendopeptidase family protein [Candidatus Accumulibacter sp.]|jgi:septal ring factor EnvC (AmiA/AmiB activator)|nr:peptidoglycan DD-metalloendopeptidase family protein [Accumulibacter sp.]